MRKKKILVVGYGGTISMVVRNNRVMPAENIKEITALLPRLGDFADLELEMLSNRDSTNVNHIDWTRIARYIADRMDKYDAFLVTHGTNTMAYTASALALAFGKGLKKPVGLTGSQLPLTVYGNDARFNFENAIKALAKACDENIAEVMVIFDDIILRGSRTVKVSESHFRAFQSPAFPAIGDITASGVNFNYNARRRDDLVPFEVEPEFTPGVLSIDLTPGQLPDLFESVIMSGNCKGIILNSHGAGSVPTEGPYNFLPLIKKTVQEYKIPVIISTKFLGGNAFKEVNDEPAVMALEAGAIPSGDMTDVMTEVKLMWVLSQGAKTVAAVRKAMLSEYVGEIASEKFISLLKK